MISSNLCARNESTQQGPRLEGADKLEDRAEILFDRGQRLARAGRAAILVRGRLAVSTLQVSIGPNFTTGLWMHT